MTRASLSASSGHLLRSHREAAGLTQSELARRAGVSRQLVGAVEAGRHLPRVDAALAVAEALGCDVAALFPTSTHVTTVAGTAPAEGQVVRLGRVGEHLVTAPARLGADGWDIADGVVENGVVVPFGPMGPGLVVAGCEPGLALLERMLRESGMGAMSATASSATAAKALAAGRLHAAVVHGPCGDAGIEAARFGRKQDLTPPVAFVIARWRVGLAGPKDTGEAWWQDALAGRVEVVQREPGAGVQASFENALLVNTERVAGPVVSTHMEAARRAVLTGIPGVTMEPAALAVGARFHPLETHEAQLWVAQEWRHEPIVTEALNTLTSERFQRRLRAVGGYDLSNSGTRAA